MNVSLKTIAGVSETGCRDGQVSSDEIYRLHQNGSRCYKDWRCRKGMRSMAWHALAILLGWVGNAWAVPPVGMVAIPGGTNSGTDPDGSYTLTVTDFYMDATEVTKVQWDGVYSWAVTNGYQFDNPGLGKATNHPVHSVNWYDCVKWCNARSEMEGRTVCYTVAGAAYRAGRSFPSLVSAADGFRLPTETEWKYAARGGAVGLRFPWGDTINETNANYWSTATYKPFTYETASYSGPHPSYNDGIFPYTSPVGSFPPNGYGLYDMTGNVWEWIWSTSASTRGRQGTSWYTNPRDGRCRGLINLSNPVGAGTTYGFRTVCQ